MKQVICLSAMLVFGALMAGAEGITGEVGGKLLASGSGLMILSATGEVEWQCPTALTHDAWLLPNGNIMYADGTSVTELTRDKKIVFQYKSAEKKGGGTYSCQRLDNGNTVIGENAAGKVLEVDPSGKVVFELQTSPVKAGAHHNVRMVRKLKNGNYLVCHSGAHVVKEYSPKGEVVLELKTDNIAFSAVRTDKGTTLVGALDKIVEFDAKGKVVWEFLAKDIPGVTIRNMTGIHLLANGNIVTGCYSAYDKGKGCGLLEITRDKKLVWSLSNPKLGGSMMAVQKLSADGKPLPGECLR
jgi:hypothetical protein